MRLVVVHFFGFRGACARSDAIGPRSRFGVLGLRRSLPACDASRLDVVIVSPFYRLLLTRLRVNKKRNLGGFCEEAVDSGRNRWMVVHNFRCSDFVPSHMGLGCSSWAYPDLRPGLLYAPPSGLGFGGVGATFGASSRATSKSNGAGCRSSHLSQRTRKMGHPRFAGVHRLPTFLHRADLPADAGSKSLPARCGGDYRDPSTAQGVHFVGALLRSG